jgi:hypothetical protein
VSAGRLRGDERLKATMVLRLEGAGLEHQIDGEIELG